MLHKCRMALRIETNHWSMKHPLSFIVDGVMTAASSVRAKEMMLCSSVNRHIGDFCL